MRFPPFQSPGFYQLPPEQQRELVKKAHRKDRVLVLCWIIPCIGTGLASGVTYWLYRELGGKGFTIPMLAADLAWAAILWAGCYRAFYCPRLARRIEEELATPAKDRA